MDGHKEAEKIDNLLNELAREHPVTKENAREWLILTRTVMSSLIILRQVALEGGKH